MKRYCDYDAIVHYQPGEFASKFADNLNEKLKPANLDALEDEQANTFKDGQYGTFLTRLPLTVYRLYGKYQSNNDMGEALRATGARLGGQYVSTEFAESCIPNKRGSPAARFTLILPRRFFCMGRFILQLRKWMMKFHTGFASTTRN